MSKSPRIPHPDAGKSGNHSIDYGPARAAICDLAAWAFDLAARDVAEWPEGERRVSAARELALARLRGECPRGIPVEDVLFTTGVLLRLFEAHLHLSMFSLVEILRQLGFPTESIPLKSHASWTACLPQDPPITPRDAADATRPAPADACDDGCGQRDSSFPAA